MTSVPESHATVQFDTALRTLAAQARTRYAGEAARLDRGLCLALNGHVTLHQDGTASVRSGRDAEVVYTVNGHCECLDAQRAPGGRCKHRWAKCLVKRATQQAVREAQRDQWYASYIAPDGTLHQGIVTRDPELPWFAEQAWLFTPYDSAAPLYVRYEALVLGGHRATADAKRAEEEAAGGLAALVCGYGKGH